jgi:subtilisin family serine protease
MEGKMDLRYRVASVSSARALAALLVGVFSATLLPIKVKGIRALPQHPALRGALALALWLLAALSAAAGPAQANHLLGTSAPGEVVVKLNPQSGATIEKINIAYNTQVEDTLPNNAGVYLLQAPASKSLQELLQDMQDDLRLSYAEPNFIAAPPEADDHGGDGRFKARLDGASPTPSSTQYAAEALGLSCAATISLGQGTTVAVLDTGVQLDHPDLDENLVDVKHYDFVDNDRNPTERVVSLDEDGDGLTDELVGHGTHVAGIVDLVAPGAKIMPLRVLSTEGYGDAFTIAKAIVYAQSNGAEVINLSLGSPEYSKLLDEVIEDATDSGVVVAAAAGNESSTLPHYPAAGDGTVASEDGLLAVTAVDKERKKAGFANYGSWVDIAAPGVDIRSAFPLSVYAYWSGTSMATPFVAGQAGLIHSVAPSLGSAGIEKTIRFSAKKYLLADPLYLEHLGAGHADVCASLSRR